MILIILACLAALIYGVFFSAMEDMPIEAALIKASGVVWLALFAWLESAPIWIIMGLLCSSVGDFALARKGDRPFLIGLGAFSIAHVMYIVGFLGMEPSFVLAPAIFFGFYMGLTELWLTPYTGIHSHAVRFYSALVALMAISAFGLNDIALKIGVSLFVISDSLLAIVLFRTPGEPKTRDRLAYLLWVIYFTAQGLLLFGSLRLTAYA